jgi:hypothetical protein
VSGPDKNVWQVDHVGKSPDENLLFDIANPLYFESARLKVNFLNLYMPENRTRPLLPPRRHGGHGEKQKQKQVFGFSPCPLCRCG